MSGSCPDCGKHIVRPRYAGQPCRSCASKRIHQNPEYAAKIQATKLRPEMREAARIRLHTPDSIAKRTASLLSAVPAEYRPLYLSLREYGNRQERIAMVRDQMRKDGVAA